MSLVREWVKTADAEYVVVSGTARALSQEHEDPADAVRPALLLGLLPWLLLRPILGRSGGGRIEVWWRDEEVCAWEAPTKHDAYAAANRVAALIRSGEWDPRRMPHPEVPGVERLDLGH